MFFGVLVLAATCAVYGIERKPSLTSTNLEKTTSSRPNQQRSGQVYRTPPYVVQLYKVMAKEPSPLPYRAEFVRSFPAKGRTKRGSFILKFNIRISKREKILQAMLHFCLKRETLKRILALEFINVRSDKKVRKTRAELGSSKCPLVPVTSLLKRKTGANAFTLVLQMVLTGPDWADGRMETGWHRKVSSPVEIVIFSSERYPVSPFLRFRLPARSQSSSKRDAENKSPATKQGCYRKSLVVNFNGLGYTDVIAPTIFDIKQCSGTCQYPLGIMSNPTQHSLIQQLLFSLYGKRVAKSTCCAPRRYVPLTTMIKDSYSGRIAIRSLEEMIVADCGCQ